MRRRFLTFMAVLVAILALFPLYSRLKVEAAPVPPGVLLGGLSLSNLKEAEEIRSHLQSAYASPVEVRFGPRVLALRPEEVDFHLDVDQMLAEASVYLDGPPFLEIALRSALGLEQRERSVPARYMLNTQALRAWLEQVAAEYNAEPQRARTLAPAESFADAAHPAREAPPTFVGAYVSDWEWVEGSPGYLLDVEESLPLLVSALASTDNRRAELALQESPPAAPTMADLERILNNQTLQFPGFAAIYVHDLVHGDEAAVDADVSFSGMSTLKIGIAAAVMAKLPNGIQKDDPVGFEVGQWLDYALGESNNFAANLLLRYLGDGDVTRGTRVFTDFMRSLGMESTYMQSGYDTQSQLAEIPTPGNTQTDWDTDPDTNLQSTPREMGRILSAIYECSEGRGVLIERYPEQITPDECSQILFYMTHDQFREMVWGGLPNPNDQWIVHKHGFAFESHSDVALVWGPNGPYVISVFLFRDGWMDWGTSNSTMQKVSRITWNFFEFQRAQEAALGVEQDPAQDAAQEPVQNPVPGPEPEPMRTPEPDAIAAPGAPELVPPPGYVPISNFVPQGTANP